MKNHDEIQEECRSLLKQYGITVSFAEDPSLDKIYDIQNHADGSMTMRLNPLLFCADYDDQLYYFCGKVLLPRLVLETSRLRIRRYQDQDAPCLFEGLHNRESCNMDGGYLPYQDMDDAYFRLMDTIKTGETRYVIALKESDEAVGLLHLMEVTDRQVSAFELGYSINPCRQRKGYAYEAVSSLVCLLQDKLHVDLLLIGAVEKNLPSLGLIQKLGFSFEGRRIKAAWDAKEKRPVDLLYYYKVR